MNQTHEVDQRTNVLVDRHICTSGELGVRREPRSKRRVRENELTLRKSLAESRGERGHPSLRSAVALVHRVQVLIVDVNTVELVGEDELREGVGRADGIRTLRGGLVRLTEGRDDDVDTSVSVL